MTIEELRDYVEEERSQNNIPYHVYSALIDGIDTLEQEPCEDAISRQAAIKAITNTSGIRGDALKALYDLPSVNPQDCDTCEVGNPCLYCKHEFEQQESEDKP